MIDQAAVPLGRSREGSISRIAHAVALAFAHRAALIVPIVALGPRLLGDREPFDAPPPAFLLVAIIALLQAGLVVGLGLLRWGRVSLRALGWHSDNLARDAVRGAIAFLAVAAIVIGSRAAMSASGALVEVGQKVVHYTLAQRALFVAIGVIAAFTEESIFRGYLQPSLVTRFGRPAGILATALFFALCHLQFAPLRLASLFLIGLVYGQLRGKDGTLASPAVANFLCWAVLGAL